MEAQKSYTASCTRRFGEDVHFRGEVTLSAAPTTGESTVHLSEAVLAYLHDVFGEDADFIARGFVSAGVMFQIGSANVKDAMPAVGRTSFAVEVLSVRVSGKIDRERSGAVLLEAAMDAIAKYLIEFEQLHQSDKNLA